MPLLSKILWSKNRKWQMIVAGIGFMLGLVLLLMAIQFHFQAKSALQPNRETGNWEYLIVTEQVSPINSLSAVSDIFSSGFSEKEIKDLTQQPFTKAVTPVSVNTFDVFSNLADVFDFYADLFFESVPDKFLDTIPSGWGWIEGDALVPVLMNREWLNMYNFNVSLMYSLPQFTPEALMGLQFKIWVGESRKSFDAKIVGFSYRMPALTVPQSFMDWANQNYGSGKSKATKLLLAVEDASDPAIKSYLENHSLEANQERLLRDSFRSLAQTIYSVTAIAGLLFTLLSLVIFLTTMQLLVSKSKEEIRLLIELGYRPATLAKTLIRQFSIVLTLSAVAGIVLVFFANNLSVSLFRESGFQVSGGLNLITMFFFFLIPALLLIINYGVIKSGIRQLYTS